MVLIDFIDFQLIFKISTRNDCLELDSILFSKYTILIHVQCLSSTLEAICTLCSSSLIVLYHIALYRSRFSTNL